MRACGARLLCGDFLPAREKHAAAAHRREQEWKIDGGAEHVRAEIAARNRDTLARAERHALERRQFSRSVTSPSAPPSM